MKKIAAKILLAFVVGNWLANAIAQTESPPARRIISSAPVVTEILFAIGAGDEVVGVDDYSKFPPEAAQKKTIGSLGNLNLETLIALQPTLVVIYGKNPDLEAFCQKRNVPSVQVMIETIADLGNVIIELGKATGREREAQVLAEKLEMELFGHLEQAFAKPQQRVLLVIGRQAGSFQGVLSIGGGSFLDELLVMAGGKNVFSNIKQAYPTISSEQIIAAAPDVIIEFSGEAGEFKNLDQRLKDWQVFQSVPAVKNGRIYFVSGDHLLIPGPRLVKIVEDIVKVLQPPNGGK